MSTIEEPGAYDALEKALPGETMFPILARDPCGPATITEWARLRRNAAFKKYGTNPTGADAALLAAELRQAANAEEVAQKMADWRKNETDQDGVRSSYHEVIKSAEEIAEAERLTSLARAVRNLRECAYHLSEARDDLQSMDLLRTATFDDIMMMLARINGLAEEYVPKRPDFTVEPTLPIGAPSHG